MLADMRTIMTSNEVMGGPSTFTMLYTTSRFHDANPNAVAAFLQALEEAIASINADKRAAARTFIDLEAQSMPIAEVLEVLNDPDIRYTTTPENVMKYADFMVGVGSIKVRPLSGQELFFPSIHHVPGG
jgi:NitT/TauT family transport system substrate-binding protein